MKAINLLKAVFSKATTNDLKEIEEDLNFLQKEMQGISEMDNKVEAIVQLFKVISPIQDRGGFSQMIEKLQKKNHGQVEREISALNCLQTHIMITGRQEFGMNRTKPGEEVTPEKVFLGNVFGLWTKTASYWLENEAECKKVIRFDASKDREKPVSNWYIINDYLAGTFVRIHTSGILGQISFLKSVS